jgi:hypothetical protein
MSRHLRLLIMVLGAILFLVALKSVVDISTHAPDETMPTPPEPESQ